MSDQVKYYDDSTVKKIVNKGYVAWMLFSMRIFTFERMMGPDMVMLMISIGDLLYPDNPEKQKELAMNHTVFFNTQPTVGAIVPGIVIGLEMERAHNDEMTNDIIQSIKAAVAAPMAGIGDTLAQSLLVPILLSIGIGLSSDGSSMGFWFFIIVYCVVMYPVSYFLFKIGVNVGVDGAQMLLGSEMKDNLISAIETLGIIVVGAVVASTASISTTLEYVDGEMSVNVQEILDSIFPGLLSLVGALFVFWLFKTKKCNSAIKMMLGMLVVAIVCYFLGIM